MLFSGHRVQMRQVISILEKEGVYDSRVSGGSPFKFPIPENLVHVMHIYPKAYIHYLPVWLKEEFAKRTEDKFIITSLGIECVGDTFLTESVITYYVTGRVRML